MTGTLRNDLRILANGFWTILDLEIGGMKHSLACFGVMELVSHSYILVYVSVYINVFIRSWLRKNCLSVCLLKAHAVNNITS